MSFPCIKHCVACCLYDDQRVLTSILYSFPSEVTSNSNGIKARHPQAPRFNTLRLRKEMAHPTEGIGNPTHCPIHSVKAYSHQKPIDGRIDQTNWWIHPRIEPMHCSVLVSAPKFQFNSSPNSFRNQKIVFCGWIHTKLCGRINLSLVWIGFKWHGLMESCTCRLEDLPSLVSWPPWHYIHSHMITWWMVGALGLYADEEYLFSRAQLSALFRCNLTELMSSS